MIISNLLGLRNSCLTKHFYHWMLSSDPFSLEWVWHLRLHCQNNYIYRMNTYNIIPNIFEFTRWYGNVHSTCIIYLDGRNLSNRWWKGGKLLSVSLPWSVSALSMILTTLDILDEWWTHWPWTQLYFWQCVRNGAFTSSSNI